MKIGAVTGRQYTKTRVRGYAPWQPKATTMEIINRVIEIIAEYDTALTIRQIFYRLVGKYQYEKTEHGYGRLVEYLTRARRAGVISFESIRDDGDMCPPIPGFDNLDQFWDTVESAADNYFVTPASDAYIEVWIEAGGMVPQIQAVAKPFGVRVIAGGGFSSVTARHNAVQRLKAREVERRVIILLIGDFDPSGGSIMPCFAEDIVGFGAEAKFIRLAVTQEQATEYNLVSAPQKATDRRGEKMPETWQAEALDPVVLAEIVRFALANLIGVDALQLAEQRTEEERAVLLAAV